MRVGFGTGRTLSSEKRIRAPIASSDDCLVAHVINRGLSPIVQCRKRAKEYFRDKCNVSSDRFCHAANNYNPL